MGAIKAQTRWGVQFQENRPRFTIGSRGILYHWKSLGSPENAESSEAVVKAIDGLKRRFSHLPEPDGIHTRIAVEDRVEFKVDYVPQTPAARK